VDAEINNVIYMELNSGDKMADGKYRKTYVAGSVDRANTVFIWLCLQCFDPYLGHRQAYIMNLESVVHV
jgi:hypothetical protein